MRRMIPGQNRNLQVLGLILLGVFLALPTNSGWGASSSGMRITQVRIRERLDLQGNLWVTKEFQVHFSTPHHGIYKDIPKRFIDPITRKHRKVEIDSIRVYNCSPQGSPYRYKVRNRSREVFIKIGDPNRTITGDRCYGISYRVVGEILRPDQNHQAIFWNMVGTGWNLPLHNVHAEVELPPEVKITNTLCYRGKYRSTNSCTELSVRGNKVVMNEPLLRANEALTVWVKWSPAIVKEIIIYDTYLQTKKRWFMILSAIWIVALILVITIWYKGSGLHLGNPQMALYHPPEEVGILEAGVLIDNSLDGRDITAALISLAQKGYIKIDQTKDTKSLFNATDYRLTLVKNPDANLTPYEAIIISKIFGVHVGEDAERMIEEDKSHKHVKGALKALLAALVGEKREGPRTSVTLREMRDERLGRELYKELSKVIYKNLQHKGYFGRHFKAPRFLMGFLGLLFFIPLNFGLIFTSQGILPQEIPGIGVPTNLILFTVNGLLGMVIVKLSTKVGSKTRKGQEITWRLEGLKEFIRTVETDRLRRMYSDEELPNVFERFLPYAVIFGEEKRWGKAFDPIFTDTGYSPGWYHGTDSFRASDFSDGISSAMSTATSGGGTGAGGGGGGGGGGGW